MLNKIKSNKKLIGIILTTSLCILVSFFIIYKLSSSKFMVVTGALILLVGILVKDPESKIKEEAPKTEQLTIFSEEVLEPVIILRKEQEEEKEKVVVKTTEKKTRKRSKTTIDLENTNSYKFNELDKKINKSKKVKA